VNTFLAAPEVLFSEHTNEVLLNKYSVLNPKKLREGFYILQRIHELCLLLMLSIFAYIHHNKASCRQGRGNVSGEMA